MELTYIITRNKTLDAEYTVSGVFMKRRLFCILIALLLLISAFLLRMSRYYDISCDLYTSNGIKGEISKQINNEFLSYQDISDIKYEQIANQLYDKNGKICAITVNTTLLNAVAAELSNVLYECIAKSQYNFGMPFGNTLGIKYLSGKGPKITVEVLPIGAVEYDIKSEMLDSGINQTIHRISVDFNVNINYIAPFYKSESQLNTKIIIAETLIIGDIPNTILSALG